MGRRRKKHAHFTPRSVDIDADVDDIDSKSSKFFFDEVDHFHAKQHGIDLDSDISGAKTSKKVQPIRDRYDEDYSSDDDDDDIEMDSEESDNDDTGMDTDDNDIAMDSGDNGSENEESFADIPSSKAWGKKKSVYYGGEDVKDVRGLDREDLEDAEEEEALKIQQRLAEEVDEDQFELFKIPGTSASGSEKSGQKVEKVDIDINSLSIKAQWKLLKQESPELKELISDFKLKSNELNNQLIPLLDMVKCGKITGNGAVYVQTKFNLYLSYLVNISFYMSLKAKRTVLTGHPIIRRLAQFRTLINKLSRIDKNLEHEIKSLLETNANNSTPSIVESDNDEAYEGDEETAKDDEVEFSQEQKKQVPISSEQIFVSLDERIRLEKQKIKQAAKDSDKNSENSDREEDRRAVPDKIKKNKGYVNKRKKKFGNPRVKHKEKYRKAKIQRKAIVREYRPEIQKYSGEATGIKAGLVRSRPIR